MQRLANLYGSACLAWVCAVSGGSCRAVPQLPAAQDPLHTKGHPSPAAKPGHVLEGRILDSSGFPLAGARVVLFASEPPEVMAEGEKVWARWPCFGCWSLASFAEAGRVLASTVTDTGGWYRFEGLKVDAYTVRVAATGFAYTEKEVLVGIGE